MTRISTEDLRIFLMEVADEIGSAHPETRNTKISAQLLRDILNELLANREAQPVAVTQFTPIADLYAVRIFDNGSAYVRDAAEALRISKRNDNAEIVEYVHIKRLQDSYTAPPAPEYPETLPCPVRLMPGLLFGKGVKTRLMLEALGRREEFEVEMDAMTPEQKAEQGAAIKALFSRMTPPPPAELNGRTMEGWMAEALLQKKTVDDLRAAMLAAVPEGGK